MIFQYSGASQGGSTTLRLACANGHLPVVQWLIDEKHMDFRAEKDSVRSPTRLVVSFEDEPESVSATCCRAAALQSGATVLLDACAHGHLSVVQWLIEEKGVDHHTERDNVRLMCYFTRDKASSSVGCAALSVGASVLLPVSLGREHGTAAGKPPWSSFSGAVADRHKARGFPRRKERSMQWRTLFMCAMCSFTVWLPSPRLWTTSEVHERFGAACVATGACVIRSCRECADWSDSAAECVFQWPSGGRSVAGTGKGRGLPV